MEKCRNFLKVGSVFFATPCNVVNDLLGEEHFSIYPASIPSDKLPEQFAEFFEMKIQKIRDEMNRPGNNEQEFLQNSSSNIAAFENFETLDLEQLEIIFKSMKKKSYAYDPVPIRVLVECFTTVGPYIQQVVNESFTSGNFPQSLKHATLQQLPQLLRILTVIVRT